MRISGGGLFVVEVVWDILWKPGNNLNENNFNVIKVIDYVKTNHFIYTENINVLYANYEREFGKFGALAGLRGETSLIKANQVTSDSSITNNYFKLYPSLHLSYKLSETNELQLNYSHRVNRPEGDEMNPFPEYQNPYVLRVGNPRLKPEDIHSVEFGNQYKKNNTNIISTIYYRYKYNGFTSISRYMNDTVLLITQQNLSLSNSVGFEFIVTSTIAKIVNVNLSTNTFYNTIDASNLGYSSKKSSISLIANLNASVNISKGTMAQLTANYKSSSLTPQGMRLPSYAVNLGLRQELLKKKASLILTVSDVFNSLKQSSVIDTPELYQKTMRKRSARLIYVGFSYAFGNQRKKEKDNAIKYDNQL